jgi:hypothetical protein
MHSLLSLKKRLEFSIFKPLDEEPDHIYNGYRKLQIQQGKQVMKALVNVTNSKKERSLDMKKMVHLSFRCKCKLV